MTIEIETIKSQFGARFVGLRKQAGLTQSQVGFIMGVSQHAVAAYEAGKSLPTVEALLQAAELFRCSTDYLLDRSDKK